MLPSGNKCYRRSRGGHLQRLVVAGTGDPVLVLVARPLPTGGMEHSEVYLGCDHRLRQYVPLRFQSPPCPCPCQAYIHFMVDYLFLFGLSCCL